MDLTSVLVALIGGVSTAICAYIAIVPQVKKSRLNLEDIESAIDNSKSLKAIKAGLVSEMRKSIIEQYWDYANRGFDLTQAEIDEWNDDIKKYHDLGGNGVITELDNSVQVSLLERKHAKNDKRAKKL